MYQFLIIVVLAVVVVFLSRKSIDKLLEDIQVYKDDIAFLKYLDSFDYITRELIQAAERNHQHDLLESK